MGEIRVIVFVVTFCLCLRTCYSTCYYGFDEEIEVIYGRSVNLRCNSTLTCNIKIWENSSHGGFVSFPSNETVAEVSGTLTAGLSEVRIRRTTLYEEAEYTCRCQRNEEAHNLGDALRICSVSITTICLAKVLLNGETIMYYSNNQSSTNGNVLQVTKYDNVLIECQMGAYLESNCPIRIDTNQGLTYISIGETFSCHISCAITEKTRVSTKSCVVDIIVQVLKVSSSKQPTLTTSTIVERREVFAETGTLWPTLILFIGLFCLLFLVAVALSAYIFFLRASTRLTSKESSRSVKLPPGTSSEEPMSYEDVDGGTNATVRSQDASDKCESLKAYYTVVTDDIDDTQKHNQSSTDVEAFYSHTIY